MKTIRLRITALEDYHKSPAVTFMNVKVAVAFDRDSGAKEGYNAIMINGEIDSGGSYNFWYCIVKKGSVFELFVDAEKYRKNKNRIKKWKMEEIKRYSVRNYKSKNLIDDQKILEKKLKSNKKK